MAQYFADDLRGRNVSDSLNAFLSGVADSDELRRVLERQAASQGCGVDGVRVKRQTICPALSDLRIWGFDTEDFAPFNASFNMEAYSRKFLIFVNIFFFRISFGSWLRQRNAMLFTPISSARHFQIGNYGVDGEKCSATCIPLSADASRATPIYKTTSIK